MCVLRRQHRRHRHSDRNRTQPGSDRTDEPVSVNLQTRRKHKLILKIHIWIAVFLFRLLVFGQHLTTLASFFVQCRKTFKFLMVA